MALRGDNMRQQKLFVAATAATMPRTRAWAGSIGRDVLAAEERAELAVLLAVRREEREMMGQEGCRQVRAPTTMTLGRLQGVTVGRCIEVQWNNVAENGDQEMLLCVFGLPASFCFSFVLFVLTHLLTVAQPLWDHCGHGRRHSVHDGGGDAPPDRAARGGVGAMGAVRGRGLREVAGAAHAR